MATTNDPRLASMAPDELKTAMRTLGYRTQGDLAAAIGVSRSAVSLWVEGKVGVPRPVAMLLRMLISAQRRQYWDRFRSSPREIFTNAALRGRRPLPARQRLAQRFRDRLSDSRPRRSETGLRNSIMASDAGKIVSRIKDEEIEWVDLRFTDPRG